MCSIRFTAFLDKLHLHGSPVPHFYSNISWDHVLLAFRLCWFDCICNFAITPIRHNQHSHDITANVAQFTFGDQNIIELGVRQTVETEEIASNTLSIEDREKVHVIKLNLTSPNL
eukprot:m.449736 g.449736  ORF g.449736 m.449736 type:complete len:115 (-) comp19868_c0_seq1:1249-1593(-)